MRYIFVDLILILFETDKRAFSTTSGLKIIPGVLGHPESLLEESFSNNLLEYPHYTRPKIWEDSLGNKYDVPEVLTSGHHSNIKKWRQDKSVEKTKKIRPDLYSKKEQEQD